jgi:hypothetical protein
VLTNKQALLDTLGHPLAAAISNRAAHKPYDEYDTDFFNARV